MNSCNLRKLNLNGTKVISHSLTRAATLDSNSKVSLNGEGLLMKRYNPPNYKELDTTWVCDPEKKALLTLLNTFQLISNLGIAVKAPSLLAARYFFGYFYKYHRELWYDHDVEFALEKNASMKFIHMIQDDRRRGIEEINISKSNNNNINGNSHSKSNNISNSNSNNKKSIISTNNRGLWSFILKRSCTVSGKIYDESTECVTLDDNQRSDEINYCSSYYQQDVDMDEYVARRSMPPLSSRSRGAIGTFYLIRQNIHLLFGEDCLRLDPQCYLPGKDGDNGDVKNNTGSGGTGRRGPRRGSTQSPAAAAAAASSSTTTTMSKPKPNVAASIQKETRTRKAATTAATIAAAMKKKTSSPKVAASTPKPKPKSAREP